MNQHLLKQHLVEGLVKYDFTLHYMVLEVCWDGLWTLSFGLSKFHGHGSWLMCEVVLKRLLLFIGPLYLIGVWFGEDQRENIIKKHV